MVTYRFFGGSRHGTTMSYEGPAPLDIKVMDGGYSYKDIFSEDYSTPIKSIIESGPAIERYTLRIISTHHRGFHFYAPENWTDEDCLEFIFT